MDVAKGGRDDAADAVIEHGVDRPLARRAAAKIGACHQDPGFAVGGLVEDEVGTLVPCGVEAQIVKEVGIVARLARFPQVTRRDDLVGVDIRHVERGGDGGQCVKWGHCAGLRLSPQ
ncbi:hypothetical protein D3C83_33200 [compost metagenome]